MGFTEAASDDGEISGRGSPLKRGIAIAVVFVELWATAWIQNRYMDTPFLRASFQVVLGGALVFAAGVLIGSGH